MNATRVRGRVRDFGARRSELFGETVNGVELLERLGVGAGERGGIERWRLAHIHHQKRSSQSAFFHLGEIDLGTRQLLCVVRSGGREVGRRDVHVRVDGQHGGVDGLCVGHHGGFVGDRRTALCAQQGRRGDASNGGIPQSV